MFEIDRDKSYVAAEREQVKRLLMSFNEPMVAPSRHSAQPAQAYIVTLRDGQEFAVYICLYLTIERTKILYKYTDRIRNDEERFAAEDEALQFTESMGFIVDDTKFEFLDTSEQDKLLTSIPLFTPPAKVVAEVAEVAEEKLAREEIPVREEVFREAVAEVIEQTESVKAEEEPALVEAKVSENRAAEEPEESGEKWVPELSLSKFRMRVAAERMARHN